MAGGLISLSAAEAATSYSISSLGTVRELSSWIGYRMAPQLLLERPGSERFLLVPSLFDLRGERRLLGDDVPLLIITSVSCILATSVGEEHSADPSIFDSETPAGENSTF